MPIRTKLCCAIAPLLIIGSSARADLLGVQLVDVPDIASGFISVEYDSATDQLVASGFARLFDDDGIGPAENIINGTFLLEATINEMGMSDGGTLTITGEIPGLGIPGGTLLSANLNAFGFMAGGGPLFDFLFTVRGGSLSDEFYPVETVIGMIMSGVSFPGSFANDFDNLLNGIPGTGSAVADIGIPAPATLALLALAALGFRRRRRAV